MSGIDRDKRAQAIDCKIDAFFDAGRDLAKALATTWLASLDDQANEPSSRIVAAIAPTSSERLMTINDLANYLQVTPRAIRGWINKQGLPVRYAGDDPRFDLAEVGEWMKRHRKINRVEHRGNGKLAPAPSNGTRPQATQRRG